MKYLLLKAFENSLNSVSITKMTREPTIILMYHIFTVSSGLRQHALLSLARMHWLRHEYVACRKVRPAFFFAIL